MSPLLKKIIHAFFVTILIFLNSVPLLRATDKVPEEEFEDAIEGDSFYILEAYLQDTGYTSHTFNLVSFPSSPKDFYLSYSASWPFPDDRNQFGYTYTYSLPMNGTPQGSNDLYVSYSHEFLTEDEQGVTFSPQFSLVLPTGNVHKGLGFGTVGEDLLLPFSKRWNNKWVTHFNLGLTVFPQAEIIGPLGRTNTKNLVFFTGGASVIYLVNRHFNFLTEFITYKGNRVLPSTFHVNRYSQTIINPGLRFSIPWGRSEIVPGFSVPFAWTQKHFQVGMFFYLSINHPFTKEKPEEKTTPETIKPGESRPESKGKDSDDDDDDDDDDDSDNGKK